MKNKNSTVDENKYTMNGFKDTEIGLVPVDWDVRPFEKVATLQRGKDLPTSERIDGNYPIIGSNGVVGYHNEYIVDGFCLTVGRSGSVGKLFIHKGRAWPLNTTLWVKDFHSNNERFVYYLLHTFDFGKYATGVSVPTLNRNYIHQIGLPVPPLPEQRRIAAVLNAIQESIAAQDDVITAARAFKRSLMEWIFTYGPGQQPAETKETEIGEIPVYWGIDAIGNLCSVKSGTTPSRTNSCYWTNGNIPWVKTGEVNYCTIESTEEYITEYAVNDTSLRLYPAGTLLLAMYGQGITWGKVALLGIDATINQACAAIMPHNQSISTTYLYHYLSSVYERLRKESHGTQQLNLNARIIEAFHIPVPPVHEQILIHEILAAADEKIAAEEDRKTALQAFFQSMLHQLMTGQTRLLSDEGLPL